MERLDVTFANRYLDALERYRRGEELSRCWRTSFRAAESWRPIVLQHLLLGINAHINLDLGVAAAQTSPGARLASSRRDFDVINDILRATLDDVQERLALVSRWMAVLDRTGGRTDEAVVNFSIERARESAWRVAEVLDRWVDVLAFVVRYPPGISVSLASTFVRLMEVRDVARVIDILTQSLAARVSGVAL